jgi:hypothetical protein
MVFGALSALRQQLQHGLSLSAAPAKRVRKRAGLPDDSTAGTPAPASPQSLLRNQCLLAQRLGLPDLPVAEKDIMKEQCADVLTRMSLCDDVAPCLLRGLLVTKGRRGAMATASAE